MVTSQCWAQETQRPNFLFILADDQAPYSLGAYGNTECSTPNLDALASRGLTFDGAYHMGAFLGAVCTASRHMIMSGRTVWHIPRATTRENVLALLKTPPNVQPQTKPNPHVPAGLEKNTLAAVFNRAGYDTMRTCKKGNSYPAANAQFTVVRDASRRQASEKMGSAWHAQQVLDYLEERQSTEDSDPFLIYFGLSHPHDPRHANEELLAKYGAVDNLQPGQECKPDAPKLPINYLAAHPFHHGHPGLRDEVAVQGVHERRDEATIRNEKGREYACIENIDNQVGRVIEKLEAMGELKNTYIVYTADHGIAIGRHGLMGKQSLYEHCWRVPYIVAGPNIAPGSRAMGNIYLLDTLATFCDLAGIAAPETNEGKSFRNVLEGRSETVRDVLFGVYSGGTKPGMRSVRKGSWKLIKYETLDGKVKETQLFDLSRNPNELLKEHHDPKIVELTGNTPHRLHVDLAEDEQFAGKLKEMEDLLLAEMERLDDPYRFGEGYVNRPKPKRKNARRKKQKVGERTTK
ncbi:MAG: sulfatase-like hydrolase/transferase [Planctomycetota bacterium]